jgi:hypothetical protein
MDNSLSRCHIDFSCQTRSQEVQTSPTMVQAETFRAPRSPLAGAEFATIRERLVKICARRRGGNSRTFKHSSRQSLASEDFGFVTGIELFVDGGTAQI